MKMLWIAPVAVVGFIGFSMAGDTRAGDERPTICGAALDGFGQVPPNITEGTATLKLRINHDGTITYKLSYSNLTGAGAVLFTDVHFGQEQNTGGILFFMCSNVPTAPSQGVPPTAPGVPGMVNVPMDTQTCPAGNGTLTGTIKPADIVGAPVQGIAAGDLAEVVEALGSGLTYGQIHTALFTAGEVRGQIEVEDRRKDKSS